MSSLSTLTKALGCAGAIWLTGCSSQGPSQTTDQANDASVINPALTQVLEQQSDQTKTRYIFRHPGETLSFFEVEPGMTVVEALPGFGWYSQILAPYLGSEGTLIGVNYPDNLWSNFEWAQEEFIAERIAATAQFGSQVDAWGGDNAPKGAGYTFATLPEKLTGQADRVLFIRALHNLNRFNAKHGFLDQALTEAHRLLKEDGILGVVQHASMHTNLDGSTGYLNRQDIVNTIEAAGFKLVGESSVNANSKDKPAISDTVWRLPPTLWGPEKDSPAYRQNMAIGETNRITLKFKKTES